MPSTFLQKENISSFAPSFPATNVWVWELEGKSSCLQTSEYFSAHFQKPSRLEQSLMFLHTDECWLNFRIKLIKSVENASCFASDSFQKEASSCSINWLWSAESSLKQFYFLETKTDSLTLVSKWSNSWWKLTLPKGLMPSFKLLCLLLDDEDENYWLKRRF